MACISRSFHPPSYVPGVITAIKYKDFPPPVNGCVGKFIDDFFLFSGCMVPNNVEATLTIKIGAFNFRATTVTNTSGTITSCIASGAVAVSANGKQLDFNDVGGTPRSVNITDGLWADGFSVVIAADSIPPGSPPASLLIHEHQAQFSMEPDASFDGINTPDVPQDLDGEPTPDATDPTKNNVTISWDEPVGGPTPLVYFIERQEIILGIVGSWVTRGFVTNANTRFVDGWVNLTAGATYKYRVQAARKLDDPDVGAAGTSAFSNEFSFNNSTPDVTIVGSGVFTFGGSAAIVTIVNPSGIYTLVTNKTNDTLYERNGATTTQNVAIPTPYYVTAYVPEDD